MPTVIFTWNAVIDARSCNKCKALHGYSWTFQDEMPNFLDHPQFGPVWDLLVDRSMAHGFNEYNCRCNLTIKIDDSDLDQLLKGVIHEKHGLEGDLSEGLRIAQTVKSLIRR